MASLIPTLKKLPAFNELGSGMIYINPLHVVAIKGPASGENTCLVEMVGDRSIELAHAANVVADEIGSWISEHG